MKLRMVGKEWLRWKRMLEGGGEKSREGVVEVKEDSGQ
jgi:hypothetical protein